MLTKLKHLALTLFVGNMKLLAMSKDYSYTKEDLGSKPVYVIYNPFSGRQEYLDKESEILNQCVQFGFSPKIIHINQLSASFDLEEAKTLVAVIVIGGDGTVRAVIKYLVNTDIPLAVVPAGTYNHLAKDLQMPTQLEACLSLIRKNNIEKIDVAEVNGHFFVNNSSIGLYPQVVKKAKHAYFTPIVKAVAFLTTFLKFPTFKVTYLLDKKKIEAITPLVFVSNNVYALDLLNLSERQTIKRGVLCLYMNHCVNRRQFIRLLINILFYKRKAARGFFEIKSINACEVFLKADTVSVAMDGDIVKLKTPLHYQIHPKQLTIIQS